MNKEAISTTNAPAAVGPYSQGIKAGNMYFMSGQIPLDPKTGKLVEGTIEEKTHQVFKNISAVVEEAGAKMENIVKATVFLADMGDFKRVNEVYAQYFQKPYPARSAVAVKTLPLNVDIEIEVIVMV